MRTMLLDGEDPGRRHLLGLLFHASPLLPKHNEYRGGDWNRYALLLCDYGDAFGLVCWRVRQRF